MMHEALPSGAEVPYDPAAFEGSFELLPVPLQAALAWSWGRHFRAFVNDLSYLIECVPGGNDAGAVPMSSLLQAGETSARAACACKCASSLPFGL